MNWPFKYSGNLNWLEDRTILLVTHGSRAYGTNRPDSDYDYKGVAIAPKSYRDGFVNQFEQAEIKKTDKSDTEAVIYDLRKFMKLAADCNPTLLEILFSDEEGTLLQTEEGKLLQESREKFLSQKALYTFRGYAMQQLRRIESHRKWLLNPPTKKPEREDYGLRSRIEVSTSQITAALSAIQKQIDSWSIDFGDLEEAEKIRIQDRVAEVLNEMQIGQDEKFRAAARFCGLEENFIHLLDQERKYEAAMKQWDSYQTWKTERNLSRSALEAEFGYDTKHGMHLVRLMRMCREILEDHAVLVKRPDAVELLAIRNGAWSYEKLMAWAKEQDEELKAIALKSTLPKAPNRVKLDELCCSLTEMFELKEK